MSNNKAFFVRKICIGCKQYAEIYTCTKNSNKVYCEECHKKFIEQPFNGVKFKSLDIIAKEQCQIKSEKDI